MVLHLYEKYKGALMIAMIIHIDLTYMIINTHVVKHLYMDFHVAIL